MCPSPASALPPRRAATGRAVHVLAVGVDELANVLTTLTRGRPGVRDRAAEANVVTDHVRAIGVGPKVLHVCLFHLEMARGVAAIVRLSALGHLLVSSPESAWVVLFETAIEAKSRPRAGTSGADCRASNSTGDRMREESDEHGRPK